MGVRPGLLLALTGCLVNPNDPPFIDFAEATCGVDGGGFVWTFEAVVFDPDGRADVRFVEADVYDAFSDIWIDTLPLDPVPGTSTWFSAWSERRTALYCGEPYLIDFVAEDRWGAVDFFTVQMGL